MSDAEKSATPPNAANDAGDIQDANQNMTAESAAAEAAAAPDAEAAAAALADRVNALEAEAQTLRDDRLRALAEAENARRRAQKDRDEAKRYGAAALARDVVSVADNLTRALAAMPDNGDNPALRTLSDGVAMVERELLQALEKHGVTAVGEVGAAFDHNTCQAVFEVETADMPPSAIAQVMQKGYMLHDRLLRPAMVGVAKPPAGADPRGGKVDETA